MPTATGTRANVSLIGDRAARTHITGGLISSLGSGGDIDPRRARIVGDSCCAIGAKDPRMRQEVKEIKGKRKV